MKTYNLLPLIFFSLLTLLGCNKDEPIDINKPEAVLEAISIRTEACFTPYETSLIVGYLDNNFYFEDNPQYQVNWYKNDKLISSDVRIDCVKDGIYTAEVSALEDNKITKELSYTVALRDVD